MITSSTNRSITSHVMTTRPNNPIPNQNPNPNNNPNHNPNPNTTTSTPTPTLTLIPMIERYNIGRVNIGKDKPTPLR